MTKQDAIEFLTLLKKALSYFEEYGHDKASMVVDCDKKSAFDLAIEALSADAVHIHNDGTLNVKVPNAQKVGRVLVMDTDSHIGGGMFYPDDAVSREEYEELYRKAKEVNGMANDILADFPSYKELVSMVRCKDCRHRNLFSCPLADNDFQKDNDFCSWGERREPDKCE